MSNFDETMLKRLTSLEREVGRLKVLGSHKAGMYADSYFDDLLYSLTGEKLESPSSHIVYYLPNGLVNFKNNCDLNDYLSMTIQMSHRWKVGSVLYPHLHWSQQDADMPNWLIHYGWFINGAAGFGAYAYQKWTANLYTYSSGALNQITKFGSITPPVGAGLSDILHVRIFRDVANTAAQFAGAESGTPADAYALNFDIHFEIDSAGSDTEYTK